MNPKNLSELKLLEDLLMTRAELHAWEQENIPLLKTSTGQHLYHTLVARSLTGQLLEDKSLKPIMANNFYTERALRLRIKEMLEDGLFEISISKHDYRSKSLVPTYKFNEVLKSHSEAVQRIFLRKFYLIAK